MKPLDGTLHKCTADGPACGVAILFRLVDERQVHAEGSGCGSTPGTLLLPP